MAYTVENIKARIAEFKAAGLRMIDDEPRSGAHHMQIAFLHPKSSLGVLTELCEPADGRKCNRSLSISGDIAKGPSRAARWKWAKRE